MNADKTLTTGTRIDTDGTNSMRLLPYDKFELTVKLPPWDVCRILLDNVSGTKFFSGIFSESKVFKGKVEETSFKIYRNIWYRNSGLPVLHGDLENLGDMTRIKVRMKLHGLVQAILVVFCAIELRSVLEKSNFDSFDLFFLFFIAAIIWDSYWQPQA